MKLVVGSDHGGFALKEELKRFLQGQGHAVTDYGCYTPDPVDYPDIALLAADAVARREFDRGVLVDGTGGGMPLAANKVRGIRAVCAYNELTGAYASEHDDANILCLGAAMVGSTLAREIVTRWLTTPFGGERHARRLGKVAAIEERYQRA